MNKKRRFDSTMTGTPPTPLREEDYEAIEAAVMESSRGRWFLAEYARRNRSSDTQTVLDAISRLEDVLKGGVVQAPTNNIVGHVHDMSNAISRLYNDLAQLRHEAESTGRMGVASADLDAVVDSTKTATDSILAAAEQIQEIGWSLRETGGDSTLCDRLDTNATDIYIACSFQDLTGQRISKVVQTLRYLESRIFNLLEVMRELSPDPTRDTRPDSHLLNGPALPGQGLEQNAVDSVFDALDDEGAEDAVFIEEPVVISPTQYHPEPQDQAAIDAAFASINLDDTTSEAPSTPAEFVAETNEIEFPTTAANAPGIALAPRASLPDMQTALQQEWPQQEEDEEPVAETTATDEPEEKSASVLDFSALSFEDKVTLFS